MYCKRCGHKQAEGEKFCPVCGEPFLDENGKPYAKGMRKNISDAKVKAAAKISQASSQGKDTMASAKKWLKEHRGKLNIKRYWKPLAIAAALIVIVIIGKNVFGGRRSGTTNLFKNEQSASNIFKSTISSTAYCVPIYETNVFGGWNVVKREVPESADYDQSLSYQWTIVFFPDDDNHGTATIVPVSLDGTEYAKAMEASFLYDISGDEITLYNGKTVIGGNAKDDVHLTIQEGDDNNVILTGHFRDKNREFKRATFPIDRDKFHYIR